MLLTNAFSINMLSDNASVDFCRLSVDQARDILSGGPVVNAIGHPDTDHVVRGVLGVGAIDPGQRATLRVGSGDSVVVAQYTGPRLPEGATSLPDGAAIHFWLLTVRP